MALDAHVRILPAVQVTDVSGLSAPLVVNCHQATCYWLYEEAKGEPPMGWAFADTAMSDTSNLMTKLAKYGTLATPASIHIAAPGTVLIFTSHDGVAGHSCIIDTNGNISGYNQIGWFTSPGNWNQFTSHAKADIKWRAAGKHNNVLLGNGRNGQLYQVDEHKAVAFALHTF